MTDRELRASVQRYVDRMTDWECYDAVVRTDCETNAYLDYMPESRTRGAHNRDWRNAFREAVNLRAGAHGDWPLWTASR